MGKDRGLADAIGGSMTCERGRSVLEMDVASSRQATGTSTRDINMARELATWREKKNGPRGRRLVSSGCAASEQRDAADWPARREWAGADAGRGGLTEISGKGKIKVHTGGRDNAHSGSAARVNYDLIAESRAGEQMAAVMYMAYTTLGWRR